MGCKNDCYIAQKASLLTYSDTNLETFLEEKNIKKNSTQFPFSSVSEFLIYLDDLVLWSSKKVENATKVHLLLVEFLLYCTVKLGFKLAKAKVHLLPSEFKFLGRYFHTNENCTSIPPSKVSAFQDRRAALSTAEAISRLGAISYFRLDNTQHQ